MSKLSESQQSDLDHCFSQFLKEFPEYKNTSPIDHIRKTDYSRLGEHVYLDYTGGGLYADSQLDKHHKLLKEGVFGNPHSSNPSSSAMTRLVDQTRKYVLDYFNAGDDYTVIFTANASGALKLIGESYPFSNDSHLLIAFDNHNSVLGIREFARAKGSKIEYAPLQLPNLFLDEKYLDNSLNSSDKNKKLFAFPAQSNFSGVKHDLKWVKQAQDKGWDVLLDAAAFVPTNRLDLQETNADFVVMSFYKIFGYPTGLGALIAKKTKLKQLKRPWFAGGTISIASVQGDDYFLDEGCAAFEDGTINYLNIPAIRIGLEHIQSIGMEQIGKRVATLTGYLLQSLDNLKHKNGNHLVKIYGPLEYKSRGGTVTMNFYDENNKLISHKIIEQEANKELISLRTGCFCNPGTGESAFGITEAELSSCFANATTRLTIDDLQLCIDGKNSGAVRVSLGLVSNFEDVFRFLSFAKKFLA